MACSHCLVGISIAALAAATASAQTTTVDAAGNTEVEQCLPENQCDLDNQKPGNQRNFGSIRQADGTANWARVGQTGADNSSSIYLTGGANTAVSYQTGSRHFADLVQVGDRNLSDMNQLEEDNSATITQRGTGNTSKVGQGAYYESEPIYIRGKRNALTVVQHGSNLVSQVVQGRANGFPSGQSGSGDDNEALVFQTGTGSFSRIDQGTRGNSASVHMFEGGPETAFGNYRLNRSHITQDNDHYVDDGAGGLAKGKPGDSNTPLAGNIADVAIRGVHNLSSISQNGVRNTALLTMSAGGPGSVQGNSSDINQVGSNNFAGVATGSELNLSGNGAAPEGQGNVAFISQGEFSAPGTNHKAYVYQRGIGDRVSIHQQNNNITLVDSNASAPPNFVPGQQDGSVADVSQLSVNSSVSLTQRGTNTGIVTQGAKRTESGGARNTVVIDQTDAGDTYSGTLDNRTVQRNFVAVAQYGSDNGADVEQNATGARAIVHQSLGSRSNSVRIRQGGAMLYNAQAVGLGVDIEQRASGSTATINQFGPFMSATVRQTGTDLSPASAGGQHVLSLLQISGDNSVASVTQSGLGHSATVEQRGNGTAANPNRVTMSQVGTRQQATAVQESTSGASGSEAAGTATGGNAALFPRARSAGAHSAEIEIFQSDGGSSSGGNNATVRQRGLGQLAVIDQRGSGNVAGILQGSDATNAVAIIEQTGDGNRFFITQSSAAQYMRVVQTGGGNLASTSASGGTPVGGATSTSSQPPLP